MKNKQTLLVISVFFTVSATAQLSPRNKKTFERSLAAIVNNAAEHFQYIKGRTAKQRNDYFEGKQYELDLVLPGVDKSVLILRKNESLVYIEVGQFSEFEEGFKLYTNLIDQLFDALKKRVYFCTDSSDKRTGNKQTRAGIKTLSGFFETNIHIDLQFLAGKYVLSAQVKGGLPQLYSIIPQMQTGHSLLFRFQFNKIKELFDREIWNVCAELPGYTCSTEEDLCRSVNYIKEFDEVLNAEYEFSNLFTEVKSALRDEFVYMHKQTNISSVWEIIFIRKEDICSTDRKMIKIKLTSTGKKSARLSVEFISKPIEAKNFL